MIIIESREVLQAIVNGDIFSRQKTLHQAAVEEYMDHVETWTVQFCTARYYFIKMVSLVVWFSLMLSAMVLPGGLLFLVMYQIPNISSFAGVVVLVSLLIWGGASYYLCHIAFACYQAFERFLFFLLLKTEEKIEEKEKKFASNNQ